MGEAKRRRDLRASAMADGLPVPRPENCPGCQSTRIHYIQPDEFSEELRRKANLTCELAACRDCRAIWEPFPPTYMEDEVCAEPCDNCAFRPGSPEQADPECWKAFIETLRPGDEGWFSGRFYCHKHVPIDQAHGPGNFLFPKKPLTMDDEIVRNTDGSAVEIPDVAKMRTCSGFLRMFWKLSKKQRQNGTETPIASVTP